MSGQPAEDGVTTFTFDGKDGAMTVTVHAPLEGDAQRTVLLLDRAGCEPAVPPNDELVAALRGDGARVVTSHAEREPASLATSTRQARDVLGELDEHGIAIDALCGIGGGATIAAGVARHREGITRILLLDPLSNRTLATLAPEPFAATCDAGPEPEDVAFHDTPVLILEHSPETDGQQFIVAIERVGRLAQHDILAQPPGMDTTDVESAMRLRACGFLCSQQAWAVPGSP